MLNHLHRKSSGSDTHASGSMHGWGKTYDRMVSLLALGQEQKFRQSTLDLARIQPGERILEVGCGTGTLALAAKAQAGREIEFQLSSIAAIPYPDGQFDLVLSSLMLHHLPGDALKRQGMQEVLRVLKPGRAAVDCGCSRAQERAGARLGQHGGRSRYDGPQCGRVYPAARTGWFCEDRNRPNPILFPGLFKRKTGAKFDRIAPPKLLIKEMLHWVPPLLILNT